MTAWRSAERKLVVVPCNSQRQAHKKAHDNGRLRSSPREPTGPASSVHSGDHWEGVDNTLVCVRMPAGASGRQGAMAPWTFSSANLAFVHHGSLNPQGPPLNKRLPLEDICARSTHHTFPETFSLHFSGGYFLTSAKVHRRTAYTNVRHHLAPATCP